jgi:hypothetical protein
MSLNVLRESDSDFKDKYFSKENTDRISNIIRHRVFKNTGYKIGPVNRAKLVELMSYIYKDFRIADDKCEIDRLSYVVINKLTQNLSVSVLDYFENLRDLDNPNGEEFLDPPLSTSRIIQNRGNADILFGDLWKYA